MLKVGDPLELRGPIGGWFVWDPDDPAPALLVAGGSGVVPLMAMIRARAPGRQHGAVPAGLLGPQPGPVIYAAELAERAAAATGSSLTYVYTRDAPPGWPARPGGSAPGCSPRRAGRRTAGAGGLRLRPDGFRGGRRRPLVDAGHDPGRIKTERFGPTREARSQ